MFSKRENALIAQTHVGIDTFRCIRRLLVGIDVFPSQNEFLEEKFTTYLPKKNHG
jgi:hypothetical protein